MSKRPPRKPTTRQRNLIKGMVEGKPVAQAAREAGYAASVIPTAIYKLIKKPAFLAALGEAMDRAGITDEKLLKRLREGLDATTVKLTVHNGGAVERAVPDWDSRHRYLETALKLKRYAPHGAQKDEDDSPHPVNFHIHLSPGSVTPKQMHEFQDWVGSGLTSAERAALPPVFAPTKDAPAAGPERGKRSGRSRPPRPEPRELKTDEARGGSSLLPARRPPWPVEDERSDGPDSHRDGRGT